MQHSPPNSPRITTPTDQTISGSSGAKSQVKKPLQLKSHNDGIHHVQSESDLTSLLNMQSHKKRKFETEECSLMDMFKEMFATFSTKLESKIEGLQATISTIKQQNVELTKSVELMSAKHDEIMSRLTTLEQEKKRG